MKNRKNVKIAIIGAGPAGIAAAIELSKLGDGDDLLVFDREDQIAMTSRHCNHQGFGMLEFKRALTGSEYADRLAKEAKKHNINIKLKHTLTNIDDDLLRFSTPDGEVEYQAQRILFAMGAREKPRPTLLTSGGRSPNIITTGALQRFVHIQRRKPFSRAVIIGSELVSFSAIMTAKHAGIEIAAIIEEEPQIKSFLALKPISNYLLKTPIHTSTKLLSINTKNKEITSITIQKNGIVQNIECDGVIFSGNFTPESSLLQSHIDDFNLQNRSTNITQNFQTTNGKYFLAGNVVRGALTAFNCFFEGKEAAKQLHKSLSSNKNPKTIKIESDQNIEWLYPSLIDISSKPKYLSNIRFNKRSKGTLIVLLNEKEVLRQSINAAPWKKIKIDCFNRPISENDTIKLLYKPKS